MSEGPLTKQIAASEEDTEALLRSNRSLSIALLSTLLKEMRDELRNLEIKYAGKIATLEADVRTLKQRIEVASVKFRELRDEMRENGGEQK